MKVELELLRVGPGAQADPRALSEQILGLDELQLWEIVSQTKALVDQDVDQDIAVAALARKIEAAGADILNTGIGWHEARIPTIATSVPRASAA